MVGVLKMGDGGRCLFSNVWVFSLVSKTSFGVANLSCLFDGSVGTEEVTEEGSFLHVVNSSRR